LIFLFFNIEMKKMPGWLASFWPLVPAPALAAAAAAAAPPQFSSPRTPPLDFDGVVTA